ncbi:MAG TPA: hypothetical protein PKE35_12005 [Anaerolineales bacterium]|nr:hypothetical protein [Anaerolineales bacterium]HMV95988.1 hypothetical protein [Anaerolineales bacterium]HMX20780.1 hypothetical protein [Anaerolineales bacterium]HMX74969.1 hypothetical protein [Anaerolineales bacterium]HMZ43827.1 hypothetical protein [Anaerolineales bacterium]
MVLTPQMLDMITGALSLLFTILIFSYVLGDNPLFRVAVYIFVGISAGYIASVAIWQVIWPKLLYPLVVGPSTPFESIGYLVFPLLGFALILMKISPRLAGLARFVMAFIVGVGAAVAIAGALSGTLIPQVSGAINSFDMVAAGARNVGFIEALVNGGTILAGTIFTLIYFHFGARPKADGTMHRFALIEIPAWIGRLFIGITLGVVFAGVYSAALTALIERIDSIINFINSFIGNFQ